MKYMSVAHITLNQYAKNEGCSSNSIQDITGPVDNAKTE